MSFKLFWYAICTLIISIAASSAWAVEALSTEELKLHCAVYDEDPEGTDGVFCIRYIQGFIDGAVATDQRVANSVVYETLRREYPCKTNVR